MSEHELWNELGNLYFMSGAYNQAVYAYNRSIQLDSGFGRPYSNLALTYVQQGRYQEAVELYRRSIELLAEDKEKAISWSRLGNVYRHLKDYRMAVVAYQRADELDPESSEGREEPGHVLYASSSSGPATGVEVPMPNEAAEEPHNQVSADTSELDERMTALAIETELACGTPAESVEDEQAALEVPESASLTTGDEAEPGEDTEVQPEFEEEVEFQISEPAGDEWGEWLPIPEPFEPNETQTTSEIAQADDLQPESDLHYCQKAESPSFALVPLPKTSQRMTGEYPEKAVQQVEVSLEEADPLPEFILVKEEDDQSHAFPTESEAEPSAQASESNSPESKEIERDMARYKRVVQVNPRNAAAWDMLGNLYKSSRLYKEAIMAYQQAIAVDSTKAIYFHHLALVYAVEGRDEDAMNTLQKVIELNPGHSLAHAALGGYYRKMGLEELAQKHIGEAMKIIYDSENEYNRACLEAIRGNNDQAFELLRVALENKQTYVDWVLRDPDLDFIRSDPRFKQLMAEYTG